MKWLILLFLLSSAAACLPEPEPTESFGSGNGPVFTLYVQDLDGNPVSANIRIVDARTLHTPGIPQDAARYEQWLLGSYGWANGSFEYIGGMGSVWFMIDDDRYMPDWQELRFMQGEEKIIVATPGESKGQANGTWGGIVTDDVVSIPLGNWTHKSTHTPSWTNISTSLTFDTDAGQFEWVTYGAGGASHHGSTLATPGNSPQTMRVHQGRLLELEIERGTGEVFWQAQWTHQFYPRPDDTQICWLHDNLRYVTSEEDALEIMRNEWQEPNDRFALLVASGIAVTLMVGFVMFVKFRRPPRSD